MNATKILGVSSSKIRFTWLIISVIQQGAILLLSGKALYIKRDLNAFHLLHSAKVNFMIYLKRRDTNSHTI